MTDPTVPRLDPVALLNTVLARRPRPGDNDRALRAAVNQAIAEVNQGRAADAARIAGHAVETLLAAHPLSPSDRDVMPPLGSLLQPLAHGGAWRLFQDQITELAALVDFKLSPGAVDTINAETNHLLTLPQGPARAMALQAWADRFLAGHRVPPGAAPLLEALLPLAREEGAGLLTQRLEAFSLALAAHRTLAGARGAGATMLLAFLDQPYEMSLETFAQCNARCTFCPYPRLERQGVRMPTELFTRLVDEIAAFPHPAPLVLNLSRVNEPLLDHRLFDFMDLLRERVPHADIYLPSNGTTLTENNVAQLAARPNFRVLTISLNSIDPAEHDRLMGISFETVTANLDRLHAAHAAGDIPFKIYISHLVPPGQPAGPLATWVSERWPTFGYGAYPQHDWLGSVEPPTTPPGKIPNAPCLDWRNLHILATGDQALCCFDGDGRHGGGNVHDQSLLALYNRAPLREMRRRVLCRTDPIAPAPCQTCPLYGWKEESP